jgi:drug/metabolite transporter (DMT)-like permease
MGLGSVLCVVVRDLSTRRLSSTTPSVTVAVWASGSVMVVGILGAFVDGWQGVSLGEGMIVASASLALLVGYMFSIMVMRVGDIGFVAPFRYTALLWAILLGWLSFGTLPDRVTVLGAAIVVTSGIYLLLRERKLRMAARMAS